MYWIGRERGVEGRCGLGTLLDKMPSQCSVSSVQPTWSAWLSKDREQVCSMHAALDTV